MQTFSEDKKILRDLAEQYMEIAASPKQNELRKEWRAHNSLKGNRPLILCAGADRVIDQMLTLECRCSSAFLEQELFLRNKIFHASLEDDWIYEPFIVIDAAKKRLPGGDWGYKPEQTRDGIAFITEPFVKTMEDIDKLASIDHIIDEKKTEEIRELNEEIFDGILDVCINRRPIYDRWWTRDICSPLSEILGYENMMMAMVEEPELVHAVAKYLQQAILKQICQANENGDFTPIGGWYDNQCLAYSEELRDPANDKGKCYSKDLWCFFAAQEFTVISPDMFDEFMLQYQMPIMEHFGLVSYGCCEDLTGKIDVLRKIPHLRRISVAPLANVAACAEQIQRDYVMSLRPNPSIISCDFDWKSVYQQTKAFMEPAKGTCFDVTFKDIETVQGELQRLHEWVKITRDIASTF